MWDELIAKADAYGEVGMAIWTAVIVTVSAWAAICSSKYARRAAKAAERQTQHLVERKMPTIDCVVGEVRGYDDWRVLPIRVANNEVAGLIMRRVEIAQGEVTRFQTTAASAVYGDLAHQRIEGLRQTTELSSATPAVIDCSLRLQPANDPRREKFGSRTGIIGEVEAYAQLPPSVSALKASGMLHAVAICSWTDRSNASFRVEFTIPLIDIES